MEPEVETSAVRSSRQLALSALRLRLFLAVVATSSGSPGATTGAGLDALGGAKAVCIFDNLFEIETVDLRTLGSACIRLSALRPETPNGILIAATLVFF